MKHSLIFILTILFLISCKTKQESIIQEEQTLPLSDSIELEYHEYIQGMERTLNDSASEFYSVKVKEKFQSDISYFNQKIMYSKPYDEDIREPALLFSNFFDEKSRSNKIVDLEIEALALYEHTDIGNAIIKAKECVEIYPFSMVCNYVLWHASGTSHDTVSSSFYFDKIDPYIMGMIETQISIGALDGSFFFSPSRNSIVVLQNTYCTGKETYVGEYQDSNGYTIIEYKHALGKQLFILPKGS